MRASSSQLAAAQMPAFISRSELEKRIFMRSATFCTSEVTVSARTKGRRSATLFKKARLLLAPGQEEDHAGEDGDEEHAQDGGEAVERVVALERDGDQQGQPEDDVEHHGRADALGGQAEGGRAARHVGVGEEPVAGGGARHRAAGQRVADGQGPHVDAEDAQAVGRAGGEHGAGQLGVGDQGGHLGQGAEDQPEDVEWLSWWTPAGAGELGQQDVLAHEEEQQHHQGDLHVARQKLPPDPGLLDRLLRCWSAAARSCMGAAACAGCAASCSAVSEVVLGRTSMLSPAGSCETGWVASCAGSSAAPPRASVLMLARDHPNPRNRRLRVRSCQAGRHGPKPHETWRSRFTGSADRRGVPLATIVVSVAAVILLLDLNAALILGLWVLRKIVVYVVIAFFFTLLFTPATRFMRRLGLSHGGAALLVFLRRAPGLRRPGLPVRRAAGHRGSHFGKQVPDLISEAKKGHGPLGQLVFRLHLQKYLSEDSSKFASQITKVLKPATAFSVGAAAASTLVALVTIAVLTFFTMLEAPRMWRGFLSLFQPSRRRTGSAGWSTRRSAR